MMSMPDNDTMDAALYGSAHIPSKLMKSDLAKILEILERQERDALDRLNIELARDILESCPVLVYSDEEPDPGYDEEIRRTVIDLRYWIRRRCAVEMTRMWISSVEEYARTVGMGEHSVRSSLSGETDRWYKAAVLRKRNEEG